MPCRPSLLLPAAFAALVLSAGCAKEPTRPASADVRLTLQADPAVGSPSNPVSVEAHAANAGAIRVWHCAGCGCGNGLEIAVLDPSGAPVALTDPNAPRPLCADGFVPLEPGVTVDGGVRFTGTLYVQGHPTFPSPTYDAPPGKYTVVARFAYQLAVPGEGRPLEQRISFVWQR